LLKDLLFNKEQLLQDWEGMDLRERSEFRIRMAKYVIPEIKDGDIGGGFNKENLMIDTESLELAIIKDLKDARKIQ